MAWTQAQLDALKNAYAEGVLIVSYGDRRVQYQDADKMLQAIKRIEAELRGSTHQERNLRLSETDKGLG